MQFISPLSVFRQLACFASLARYLFENRCFEGAVMVADRISSIVSKLNAAQTRFLKGYHISYFVNAIFILEMDPQTTSPTRIETVVAMYSQLEFNSQCQLIIELQPSLHQLLKDYPSCRQPFRQLCKILASSDIHSASCRSELVVPLVRCFVYFEDINLLQMLTDKICLIAECDSHFLDSIFLSRDMLDIAKFSNLGKKAVAKLLGDGIKQMLDRLLPPKFEESTDVAMQPVGVAANASLYDAAIMASLLSYLDLVLLMERIPDLADTQRVFMVGLLFARLPLEPLIDLILEAPKKEGLILKEDRITYDLFRSLCHLIDLFDENAMAIISCKKTVELVKLFVWLGDGELLQSLLKQVRLGEQNSNRNAEDKKILTEIIASQPNLLDQLIPEYFSFATITREALFECWVSNACDLLTTLDSDAASPPEYLADQLDGEISSCVLLYLQSEKEFPNQVQQNNALFAPLFNNMSAVRFSRLLVTIYHEDLKKKCIFKESTNTFHFWSHIGRMFVNKDLNNPLKSDNDSIVTLMVDVMICLLWLGDDGSLIPFTHKICSSFLPWLENPVVSKIVSSARARDMAETCLSSRKAFCLLVEQRIERLKIIKSRGSWGPTESDTERDFHNQVVELRALLRKLQNDSEPKHFTILKSQF